MAAALCAWAGARSVGVAVLSASPGRPLPCTRVHAHSHKGIPAVKHTFSGVHVLTSHCFAGGGDSGESRLSSPGPYPSAEFPCLSYERQCGGRVPATAGHSPAATFVSPVASMIPAQLLCIVLRLILFYQNDWKVQKALGLLVVESQALSVASLRQSLGRLQQEPSESGAEAGPSFSEASGEPCPC